MVKAQQTFPIQMEGDYLCEPRTMCNVNYSINIALDSSDINRFILNDSCPNSTGGEYKFEMYSNSTLYPDSFYFISSQNGLICFLKGRFYPQNDSLFINGSAFGCGGGGCTCSHTYKCNKILSTSLSEKDLEAVQLFPNPVQEQLRFKGLKQATTYRLHNLQGQLLLNGQVQDGNAIELGKLAPGIYLLQLGESDKSVWQKVVKE